MKAKGRRRQAEVVRYLERLGVSPDAAEMYQVLLGSRALTIKELAHRLCNLPSANYRLAYELAELGLIYRIYGRPMRFQAYPLSLGVQSSYDKHRKSMERLVASLTAGGQEESHHVELVVGRQALYDKYEQLAARACSEILVYAIGIAFSKSLFATQKSARKRGVVIRHAVQRVKSDNYHIIHKWQGLGVQLRHAPAERGFHFMLFDRRQVLISFSEPNNTDNRLSILTDSSAAAQLFLAQFEDLWTNARSIG